jgi:PadR family transcriptional regulator, regulatory protein PadR
VTPNNTGVPANPEPFAADLLRGHTDTIVLGVLRRSDQYGYEIYKSIRDATGGEFEIKEATLYATFRRLVKDGLVEAYWGDETQGGRRKYYRITDSGRAVYSRNVKDWTATQTIINTLLGLNTGHLKGSKS